MNKHLTIVEQQILLVTNILYFQQEHLLYYQTLELQYELQVLHEILQVLNVVECYHSFASSNGDSERFQRMFPDSNNAKSYSQDETKTKYIIQCGVYTYVKDETKTKYIIQCGVYTYVKDELIKDVNGWT